MSNYFELYRLRLGRAEFLLFSGLAFSASLYFLGKEKLSLILGVFFVIANLFWWKSTKLSQSIIIRPEYGMYIHTQNLFGNSVRFYHFAELSRAVIYEYLGITAVYFKLGIQSKGSDEFFVEDLEDWNAELSLLISIKNAIEKEIREVNKQENESESLEANA